MPINVDIALGAATDLPNFRGPLPMCSCITWRSVPVPIR
ncbi:Uncharacterised protein [Mycobacteroides abscessus]|nr:Uncharacterised protein [Mycobacteroides abscessus]